MREASSTRVGQFVSLSVRHTSLQIFEMQKNTREKVHIVLARVIFTMSLRILLIDSERDILTFVG